MEARTNTGTNPGYFESQKKLDAFEKSMGTPKATAQKKTKQPGTPGSTLGVSTKSSKIQVKKPIANLPKNPGTTSGSISPGKSVNVSKSSSASSNLSTKLTSIASGNTKANSKTQNLINLASNNQPRKDVKNMSSKNYLTKGIKPSYKNN